MRIRDKQTLKMVVEESVNAAEITDVHTHLYPSTFGDMLLWGIDELLTYHYLIAEYFRYGDMEYKEFFTRSKREQADLIWQKLFVEHSPISEARRGVLTVLAKLGLDVSSRDLNSYRKYFKSLTVEEYINKVFEISGVKEVVMTNDPFDPLERTYWNTLGNNDQRFLSALRIDRVLNEYEEAYKQLVEWGYNVENDLREKSIGEIKRFLTEWAIKIDAQYLAASVPPAFTVPQNSKCSRLVEECVLPVCRELNIPFAMMIGVKKLVNKELGLAGDSLGKADIQTVEYLCAQYPENKFMVTMLSLENQHELAVVARKFKNLMVFGCWWFLNNPSIVEEITRMRMELLGLSFIPQHSDARVMDHLIYKWNHFRSVSKRILVDKYSEILENNWCLEMNEITRDIEDIFSNNYWKFTGSKG